MDEKEVVAPPNEDQVVVEPNPKEADEKAIPAAILKHGLDADEALKAFIGHEGEQIVLNEETNRRLLRKIDRNIMPLMCIVYGLNYLDKTTLSYAR
jgi:MFS transporter, ACS family, allantoate permease